MLDLGKFSQLNSLSPKTEWGWFCAGEFVLRYNGTGDTVASSSSLKCKRSGTSCERFKVVGKLSDAPLVHLSCPSRAPLVPLLCPSRAPLVHLSCPSRAPLVHLWRQCPRVPTVSQPCPNRVKMKNTVSPLVPTNAPLLPLSCPSRAPLVPLSCTSRAPLVPLSCTSCAPLVPLYPCPNRVLSVSK